MIQPSIELLFSHIMKDPKYSSCFRFPSRQDFDFPSIRISGIRLISRKSDSLQKDILYFGRAADCLALSPEAIRPLHLVVTGSQTDIQALSRRCEGLCIWLADSELLNCLFNDMLTFFTTLSDWSAQADVLIAQREPLQNLLNISEDLLKNPVVMWDSSFKLVMRPTFRVPEIPIVQEWVDSGSIPGPYVEQFIASGYLRRYKDFLVSSLEPRQMTDYPFELRVFFERRHHVLVMAQYYVHEPVSLAQKELLGMFEDKIDQYFATDRQIADSNQNLIYEPFLRDLIHGALGEADIRDKLEYIHMPYEDKYVLYAVTIDEYSKPVSSYVRKAMKTIFPVSHAVDEAGTIYLLNRRESDDPEDLEYRTRNLNDLMNATGCRCGVSRPVPNLVAVQYAAQQCLAALTVGRIIQPEARCWYYRDLYIYDMLLTYIGKMGGSPESILYPTLQDLIANDARNDSDNLRLLTVFLDYSKNITNTAKEMFLHRNTIIYRIERIEKILNASLDDPGTRLDLLLSLKCLELQKHLEENEQPASS